MFFTREQLAVNSRLRGQWGELWANRDIFNSHQANMVASHRASMSPEMLACNAPAGFMRDFWQEVDRQVVQLRDQEVGMEILTDLLTVQTVLPVGKTAKLYNIVGDIADDVSVSLDGQAPYSFDHTEYNSDGDPIPVFSAGYGVNWRHAAGLNTVGIDLVLDSQAAKMRVYNGKLVSYLLDGNANIQVATYPGQGLRNHRNTIKIDLDASGANIDLTTATPAAMIAFFTTGAFGQAARTNKVTAYDVLWVSYEIWANLSQPYLADLGGGASLGTSQTVAEYVSRFIPVREIRPTYALTGNEFLGYQRRQDVVSPLIGMATGVVPLPRPLPNTNYNFQILGAMGVSVKKDGDGHAGVIYGANIA